MFDSLDGLNNTIILIDAENNDEIFNVVYAGFFVGSM
jgi:hypothetical protein